MTFEDCPKWIDYALKMGYGICNTGNHVGVMYLDPSSIDNWSAWMGLCAE